MRYTIEEVSKENKIVGIKLPNEKKIQWAIYKHGWLLFQKTIEVTSLIHVRNVSTGKFMMLSNIKTTKPFFNRIKYNVNSLKVSNDKTNLNKQNINIADIVSVDISKCKVSDRIKKMSTKDLKHWFKMSRNYYSGDLSIQEIIEMKAELLTRTDYHKKSSKPNLK